MYVEIDFNLLYKLEKIAKDTGKSVTELVNEAVTQYLDRQMSATETSEADEN